MDGKNNVQERRRQQYLSAPSPNASTINTIPLKEMIIAGHISCSRKKGRGVGSVALITRRKKGKHDRQFRLESNDEDSKLMMSKSGLAKEENEGNVVITMWEIPDETPRLVCYCVPRKQTGSPC